MSLPENTSYIKKENVQIPNIPKPSTPSTSTPNTGIADMQAKQAALRQRLMDTMNAKMTTPSAPVDLPGATGIFPSNISLKPSFSKPVMPTGQQFVTGDETPSQDLFTSGYNTRFTGVQPSDKAVIRTVPGIGQYIHDPNNKGEIIRSVRPDESDATWQSIKQAALEGRPGYLYQVDHSIPLWLGGTNNAANLQVLTRPEHASKTKAEAVALTLFANKVIDRDEAFYLATTWRNRDLTDIPLPKQDAEMDAGQIAGQISLQKAIEIRDKWKAQETAKATLSFGDTVKALLPTPTNLTVGGKALAEKLDKKTENWNPFVAGLTKGFLQAVSSEAIKKAPDEDTTGVETAGNIIGNVAGMLIPIGLMGRVYGRVLGVGVTSTNAVKGAAVTSGILKNTQAVGSAMTSASNATALGAAKVASKIPFFKASVDPRAQAVIKAATDSFVKWTPAVATYGQASETFEENPERVKRLVEDIFYGGLTGYVSPSIRGAAKVGAISGVASLMFEGFSDDPQPSFQNALITALTMGALHGVAAPGVRQQAEQIMLDETSRMANNMIGIYLPRVKAVGPKEPVPVMSLDEVAQLEDELRTSILKQVGGSADGSVEARLSDEQFAQQQQMLGAALDILRFRAMGDGPELDKALSARLQQWADIANDTKKANDFFGGPVPKYAPDIVHKMPDDLINESIPYQKSENFPSGFMRTTGLAEGFTPDHEVMGTLIGRWVQGRVSPTLIAVSRPERTVFNRLLSENPNVKWTDSNPENTVQVLARTLNEKGEVEILNVGYIPQPKRIEGETYSFNSQKEIKEGKFPAYDVNVNKDSIAERMSEEGIDYVFLTLNKTGFFGDIPGQPGTGDKTKPYVEFLLGDNHWKRSIEWQKNGQGKVSPTVENDGIETVLQRVNNTKNEAVFDDASREFVNNFPEPAHILLDTTNPVVQGVDTGGITQAKQWLEITNKAMSSKSADEMAASLKQNFGVNLKPEEAALWFDRRLEMSVEDVFSLIRKRGNPIINKIYNDIIGPDLRHLVALEEWEYKKIFAKMKVVKNQPEKTPELSPVITGEVQPLKEDVTLPAKESVVVPGEKENVNVLPEKENITVGGNITATENIVPPVVLDNQTKLLTNKLVEAVQTKAPEMVKENIKLEPPKKLEVAPASKLKPDSITKAASILIPQEGARSTRQQAIDRITKDIIIDAKRILEDIPYTSRNGEEGYKKALAGVVRNVEINVDGSKPLAGGVPLSRNEKVIIRQDAQEELARIAERVYFEKINTENAISFKLGGMKPGDELYDEVMAIQRGLDLRDLGDNGVRLQNLRLEMGDEKFEKAYLMLNPYAGESVSKIGKTKPETTEKVKLDLKGGLLGDVPWWKINRSAGTKVVKDIVDNPLNNAKPGTYMHTFAKVVEKTLTKTIGKKWREDENLLKLLGSLDSTNYNGLWSNLLKGSEGEATQPLNYLRELGKGQTSKAKEIAQKRKDAEYKESQEVLDRKSGENKINEEAIDDTLDVADISNLRTYTSLQQMDENIPAPSPIDRILAGLTTAIAEGYTPTQQQALADAMRFMFAIKGATGNKLNNKVANEVLEDMIKELEKMEVRLTNVKDPLKKAGEYFADARTANKKANEILTGELTQRFKNIKNLNLKSVTEAKTMKDKITAAGIALDLREKSWEQGQYVKYKKGIDESGKEVWVPTNEQKELSKEEIQFVDSWRKYQNLVNQVDEATRAKDIMKIDWKAMTAQKKQSQTGQQTEQ